jgi:D-glycero-alpha-D-manno-heptose-7-phosphate kinase
MPQAPPYCVCARAPLRVDLAGGGTDVPLFAAKHGGAAVGAAISLGVHVEVRLGGSRIRLRSEDRDRRVTVPQPSAITYDGNLDAQKAALNMLPVTGGIEILTRSDAPAGAGLGERGALDVAVLGALANCRNERYDSGELADLAFQLETQELRRSSGRQDPLVSALGGVQMLEVGAAGVRSRTVPLDPERLAEGSAHLVVVCLGRTYGAASAAQRVWEAVAGDEADVVEAMTGLRDLVAPMVDSWQQGDWRRAGGLLDDAGRHYPVLDPIWSAPPTARLVAAIRDAGAWGVKPAGPRAGASLLAMAPPDSRSKIASAAQANGGVVLDCAITTEGVSVWREDLLEA